MEMKYLLEEPAGLLARRYLLRQDSLARFQKEGAILLLEGEGGSRGHAEAGKCDEAGPEDIAGSRTHAYPSIHEGDLFFSREEIVDQEYALRRVTFPNDEQREACLFHRLHDLALDRLCIFGMIEHATFNNGLSILILDLVEQEIAECVCFRLAIEDHRCGLHDAENNRSMFHRFLIDMCFKQVRVPFPLDRSSLVVRREE